MSLQQRRKIKPKTAETWNSLFGTGDPGTAVLVLAAFMMYKMDQLEHRTLDESGWSFMRRRRIHKCGTVWSGFQRRRTGWGVRSDSMMIVSINNKTGAVQIISVFRDTLMQQQDGSYEKANAAYSFGGPQEAVAMLNRNLDLDITKYASVNFNALADIIDILGGVE